MTVRDLIEELSKYPPHMPVKVTLDHIYGGFNDKGEFHGDMPIPLGRAEAMPAYNVRNEGTHILIESE